MGDGRALGDSELLVAAAEDVEAFEEIYRRYVRRVAGFAAKRCASAEDVADVVAQTFMRLLDAAARYEPERAEAGAFIVGVAANVVRDVNRKGARQRALVDKLSGRDLLDDDDVDHIAAAIDASRGAGAVGDAVDAVPPAEQQVLRLIAAGRTPLEAAQELGISPGAARTRLSRARARVRNRLSDTNPTKETAV